VPCGGAALAAEASQPAVPADDQRPGETSGAEPALPGSLRPAQVCRPSPGRRARGAGSLVRIGNTAVRGSAPRRRCRIFFLRPSGVLPALRALEAEPVPAVLQSVVPSGVTAGDRAGAKVATTDSACAAESIDRPLSRPLSWLTRMVVGDTSA